MSVRTKKDLHIPFSWTERRPVFLERFFYLPKQYEHAEKAVSIDWSSAAVFGNDRPVFLEVCSGNGQWIAERAKASLEKNWVAVEMQFERARKIWLKVFREQIPNLYVVCAEAGAFIRHYILSESISEVFINFPDPWPKLRHAKHRIVQTPFLQALARVVQKEGRVTLVTDSPAYRDQMIREFARVDSWLSEFAPPYYRLDWSSYGESFFGNLWKNKGLEIFYLRYRNGYMDRTAF